MADHLNDELDGLLIPWHWECVQLDHNSNNEPKEWCEKQNWQFGIDFYLLITNKYPMYSTEWGRFHLDNHRIYNFLFKNPKHATIFRLRWSS